MNADNEEKDVGAMMELSLYRQNVIEELKRELERLCWRLEEEWLPLYRKSIERNYLCST